MSAETIWLYDVVGSYHAFRCRCENHCRNCFDDLGYGREHGTISQRSRYCSDYCRNRAKRERALDRAIAASVPKEEG